MPPIRNNYSSTSFMNILLQLIFSKQQYVDSIKKKETIVNLFLFKVNNCFRLKTFFSFFLLFCTKKKSHEPIRHELFSSVISYKANLSIHSVYTSISAFASFNNFTILSFFDIILEYPPDIPIHATSCSSLFSNGTAIQYSPSSYS